MVKQIHLIHLQKVLFQMMFIYHLIQIKESLQPLQRINLNFKFVMIKVHLQVMIGKMLQQ